MHEYTNVSTNILTSLKIIPDDVVQIDPTGTLRIERTQLSHRGDYRCLASNPAGKDLRDTLVVVQGIYLNINNAKYIHKLFH